MKITVIGGAGVRTVIFINGLLKRYKALHIEEVVLYDIDYKKLETIEALCKQVILREGKDLKLSVCRDIKEAITGADYIVTTLRVGGDHSRVIDETVALNDGVIGQETTGVGGFSMAVRTIPVLLDYCKLIKEYAPNAVIFNFTNPSGLVTQALKNAGYKNVIGICDAPSSCKFRMAANLGVDEKDLYVEFYGLNHLSWIRSVKNNGKEILQELLQDDEFLNDVEEFKMFDKALLRDIGLLPNEYLYYYYHREKALDNMLKSDAARGKSIENINIAMMKELEGMHPDTQAEEMLQTFLYYMQLRENSYMSAETGSENRPMSPKGSLEVPDGMGYAGVMLDCIEGLQSDEGRYLVLSVENNGSIPELKDDDVIEITCKVSKNGIEPVKITDVPEDCMLLIRLIKNYENLVVKALYEDSRSLAIRALMQHPLISSYSLAKKLIEDYETAYNKKLFNN